MNRRTRLARVSTSALLLFLTACDRAEAPDDAPLPEGALELRDVGFQSPESVLHDASADVYLVSNINGGGRDRDDNGFISRVSPDGQLLELKWIDGADPNVNLSAPKGSAIIGDSLFIADIDSIRIFDRNTGAPLGALAVPQAVALNDLAVTSDGALWVSDMGESAPETLARTGVHRIAPDGTPTMVATGAQIDGPNGLAPHREGVVIAGFRGTTLHHADGEALRAVVATLPRGGIDGIVALPDGSLLASSWEARSIFRVAADGTPSPLLENLQSPADIGYDAARNRLLVPSFEGNWLRMYPIE